MITGVNKTGIYIMSHHCHQKIPGDVWYQLENNITQIGLLFHMPANVTLSGEGMLCCPNALHNTLNHNDLRKGRGQAHS